MLALSRDLGQLQGRFRSCHKMREAMAEEMKGRVVGGEGQRGRGRWWLFRWLPQAGQHGENRIDRRLATTKPASARSS